MGEAAEGRALHNCRGNHGPSEELHREFINLRALSRGQATRKVLSGDLLFHLLTRNSQICSLQVTQTRAALTLGAFRQKAQCLGKGRTQPSPHLAFLCWFTTACKPFLGSALGSGVKAVDLTLACKCVVCRTRPIMD